MTIDKNWISLRNRNAKQFKDGLEQFIEIAKKHVNSHGEPYCPCRGCHNGKRQNTKTIYAHVIDKGFSQSYKTWVYHGEEHPNTAAIDAISNPYLFKSGSSPTAPGPEMFDAIQDVMDAFNTNKENEDEGGTSLDPEFDDLFKELNTELYPG
ncbi:hypothetical protein SSX86_017279 [Deinandra increscens subsp. villosa]|uniref:Transposase-associated domain-containing protein n=1 Tax=Deinandra increscens subsp. villosa TaxID=3103831 RepID=A0AAP0CUY9_9ASTR